MHGTIPKCYYILTINATDTNKSKTVSLPVLLVKR